VRIGDTVCGLWTNYSIDVDMLVPADQFSMTLAPGTREVFELCRTDAEVSVLIDRAPILTGYIDRRRASLSGAGSTVAIAGMDKGGRLVTESMPLTEHLPSLDLEQLMLKVASPWYPRVVFSNARNRDLVRGRRGRRARAGAEPIFASRRFAPTIVDPGMRRWELAQRFLDEAGLLAWSAGDGAELVVGLPNYDQEPQWRFFVPAEGSRRRGEANTLGFEAIDDISDRYSEIRVLGAGRGNRETYGRSVTRHEHIEIDVTGAFLRDKKLIVAHSRLRSGDEAERLARREMAVRAGKGRMIEILADGHGQSLLPDTPPTLFAIDTVAEVEVEEWPELSGRYLVVGLTFLDTAEDGETTMLRLVPVGTTLAL
jgi:prophage tail gpP-like protein